MTTRSTAWLIPVTLGCLVAGGATAQNAVGQVASVVGKVRAAGPGGADRVLACGDTVYAGDTVSTGLGSSAGIVMNDVLARVDGASAVKFGLTPDGTPDTELDRGRVRVIDARDEGAPARLAARNAQVHVAGNDAEAYLLEEKVGPYAMFCEWDSPLEVSRGSERTQAAPNQCVIAKDSEPLYVADAHEDRIPVEGGAPCPPVVAAGPHFSPDDLPDVGAGPVETWSSVARGIAPPDRDPCGDPGSGCISRSGAGGSIFINEAVPAPENTAPVFGP
jgi:hypothetical protein